MSFRVVVVDDDRAARQRIGRALAGRPQFAIVGESDSGPGAAEVLRREKPDLAFLDVQLPGCDGIEVLQDVDATARPLVVFLTSFEYDTIEALEACLVPYLLKPYSEERFEAELSRAVRVVEQGWRELAERRLTALLERRVAPERPVSRFVVRDGEAVRQIELDSIDWFEAQADGVKIHVGEAAYPVRLTMQAVEQRLDSERFLRVHRSAIIRMDRIARVEPVFAGEDLITLVNEARVRIGRTYRESVRAILQGRLRETGGVFFSAVRGRSSTGRATDF